MNYTLQIQKILLSFDETTNYSDKIKLLKQAIHLADANNDLDWGYDLRLDLIHLEKGTSHCIESFPAFTWILDVIAANPELFDENDILMEYKWLVVAAYKNTAFSMEQIMSITNDFKNRLESSGQGLYTFYVLNYQRLIFSGYFEEALQYKILRDQTPSDSISFCSACLVNANVEYELLIGDLDKAIVIADDLISGRDECKYEPFTVLSILAYHMAKRKDERGCLYFSKAEEELSSVEIESYMMLSISYLIFHSSVYDKDKAWSLFEKYSEWDVLADDYTSFYFAANILYLLKDEGVRMLELNQALPYYNESGQYDILVLHDYFQKRAGDLANKFDVRNCNTYFSKILRQLESFS